MSVKGVGRLRGKVDKMSQLMQEAVIEATDEVAENVKGHAIDNLSNSGMRHPTGELVGSVTNEDARVNLSGNIEASVFTDKKQGLFREFGTGPVGNASQKDLPPGIVPVYRTTPWGIPADEVSIDMEAIYGFKRYEYNGKEYYWTLGQPARPWLYPALKQGMEKAPEIYRNKTKEKLKGLAK